MLFKQKKNEPCIYYFSISEVFYLFLYQQVKGMHMFQYWKSSRPQQNINFPLCTLTHTLKHIQNINTHTHTHTHTNIYKTPTHIQNTNSIRINQYECNCIHKTDIIFPRMTCISMDAKCAEILSVYKEESCSLIYLCWYLI